MAETIERDVAATGPPTVRLWALGSAAAGSPASRLSTITCVRPCVG
jgi:hypothetical protein